MQRPYSQQNMSEEQMDLLDQVLYCCKHAYGQRCEQGRIQKRYGIEPWYSLL